MTEADILRMGAIVCADIANQVAPILIAERSEPVNPADSGWQFTCGRTDPPHFDNAQVWLLREVLEREPSLKECTNLPVGTRLQRESDRAPWSCVSGGNVPT